MTMEFLREEFAWFREISGIRVEERKRVKARESERKRKREKERDWWNERALWSFFAKNQFDSAKFRAYFARKILFRELLAYFANFGLSCDHVSHEHKGSIISGNHFGQWESVLEYDSSHEQVGYRNRVYRWLREFLVVSLPQLVCEWFRENHKRTLLGPWSANDFAKFRVFAQSETRWPP